MNDAVNNQKVPAATVAAYFCMKDEPISYRRIVALTYLADWFSALSQGSTITPLQWEMSHSGPEATGISSILRSADFSVREEGGWPSRKLIAYRGKDQSEAISPSQIKILNMVSEKTKDLYFSALVDLVYSTYPVTAPTRHKNLDLEKIAQEYHQHSAKNQNQHSAENGQRASLAIPF